GGGRQVLAAEFISSERGTLLEDRQGQLWYRANDLFRVREENGKVRFESTGFRAALKQSQAITTFQIRQAVDGSMWITTNAGVARRLPDGRVILYRHDSDLRQGAVSLIVARDGRVWVVWGADFFVIK